MSNAVAEIIEYQSESYKVDFKQQQYQLGSHGNRNELLKDLCAFANQPSDEDKFIIIGIKEDGINKEVMDIGTPVDEAKYQQFAMDNLEPTINFEYKTMVYQNKTIGYFMLFNNAQRPYLFKKNAVHPATGKVEYHYGDGYIRIGTSSRKIGRKELDDIQRKQVSAVDRRKDIAITPVVGTPSYEDLYFYEPLYLDINLSNNSNKSIDLDVEMTLYKGGGYQLDQTHRFRTKLAEKKRERSLFPHMPFNDLPVQDLHCNISESSTELKIARVPIRSRTAITLAQHSSEVDIFSQNILVFDNEPNLIKAEVIIRSDDFVEGVLKKEILFRT